MTTPQVAARLLISAGLAAVLASVSASSTGSAYAAPLQPPPAPIAVAAATLEPPQQRTTPSRRRAATRTRAAAAPVRYAPNWSAPRGLAPLSGALAGMLDGSTRSGQWGVVVVSLTRGDTLFARNPDVMMQPASTMKMYSAAVALDRFGADHRFRTAILRDGDLSDGVLQGNVYLRGDGDPALGSQRYWRGEQPMDVLARQLLASGVKHVRGDVVADPTLFDDEKIPQGWKTTYLGSAYAAPMSALTLSENVMWVVAKVVNGRAVVELEPATTSVPIVGGVSLVGGSGGSIRAVRQSDGSLRVSGSIGRNSPPRKWSLVINDPPLYAGGALKAALLKAGVRVDGAVRIGSTAQNAEAVAAVASPPLSQLVTEMNRESINVFAELLYRNAARSDGASVTAPSALAHLRQFMTQKVGNVPAEAVNVADGSGLSTINYVTARSMVHLLGYAHEAEWGPVFHASLPIVGESGTLRRLGANSPARGNLHAKTGTTNTVSSLSGYVTARNGEVIAFAFVYNGADRSMARGTMNSMGATLSEWMR